MYPNWGKVCNGLRQGSPTGLEHTRVGEHNVQNTSRSSTVREVLHESYSTAIVTSVFHMTSI